MSAKSKGNGPVWLFVRGELLGIAYWIRRRRSAAQIGAIVLLVVGLFASWPKAALLALAWWAITRVPRARAERRYLVFHELAAATATPIERKLPKRPWRNGTAEQRTRRVRPRAHVHIRRWTPCRVRGRAVMLGTVPQRGVLSYHPKFFKDFADATRRKELEKALALRLAGHSNREYRFDWQPGQTRLAFRALPPLPSGKVAYAHQEQPWYRLPVGPTRGGATAVVNLYRRPHVILSGSTGSGKTSVAMVWLAHLLRFPEHVEIVVVDPPRLDLLWTQEYVSDYSGGMAGATQLHAHLKVLERVRKEANKRMAAYDSRDWRTEPLSRFHGLVVLIEELAVLGRAIARSAGKDAANAFLADVLELAEVGRKLNIHLIVIAQQPNAEVFNSTEARDQFEWSVLCGNPSKEHKQMLSSHGLELPDLNRPGRVAIVEGQTELIEAHAYWLASPSTPGMTAEDRQAALAALPEPATPDEDEADTASDEHAVAETATPAAEVVAITRRRRSS